MVVRGNAGVPLSCWTRDSPESTFTADIKEVRGGGGRRKALSLAHSSPKTHPLFHHAHI